MKCPHCKKKFDQICGKLFCSVHGWHELDQEGGIVPADQPTEAELKKAAAPVEQPKPDQPIEQQTEDQETGGVVIVILIIAAVVFGGYLVVREIKRIQKNRSIQEAA